MATILVADDDQTVSHLVASTLRRHGHTVVQAFDAMQTVMFALRAPHPDLIVLDIRMPGGTGLSALQKIRASARTAAVPVVVLSGSTSEEERGAVESLGVNASLRKPVDPEELVAAVGAAIAGGTHP